MARPLRPQIEGGIYHIASRGNRKCDIYVDNGDRKDFLRLLRNVVDRFEWNVHAYCLMTTHYHLVVETPRANVSRGMHRLNSIYAAWFNWRHGFRGHLFQDRFWSDVIDTDAYFLEACRYVVLNPVRAAICDDPGQYPWSSYHAMMDSDAFPLVAVDGLIELFGGNSELARVRYKAFIADRVDEAIRGRQVQVRGLAPAIAA